MKKLILRLVLAAVVLLVLVVAGSLLFIGTIVKTGVEKVGPRITKVPVKLDSADISVFSGSGELKGFVLGNPEGYKSTEAMKVGTVALAIEPGSILSEKKHIKLIKIENPQISYETKLTESNLGKILDNLGGSAEQDQKAPTKDQKTSKTKLQVDEFVITGAKVQVGATLVGSATITLPEIRLEKMGQGPDGITPAELGQKAMSAILSATVDAVRANAGKLGEAGKNVVPGATDTLKKGLDLFKKKE